MYLSRKSFIILNEKSFVGTIDFSKEYGVNARITGQFEPTTGVISWIINTIDTATNQITYDPVRGILPPDSIPPIGEGSVEFQIKFLKTILNADTVRNSASIIFDGNKPILTPIWQNITDTIRPQSRVKELAPTTYSDTIKVSWTGSDNGPSGLYKYNIYYKKNNDNWLLWKLQTSDTTGIFIGEIGSTYSFYSIAIDSALNIENTPDTADASTEISSSVLAVSLVSFNASCSNNNIQLNWVTANESGIKNYSIEKSIDGLNWVSANKIIKPNNSQLQNQYKSSDQYNGYNFYRIAIYDIDGNLNYSTIEKINCGKVISNMQAYPVPAKDLLNILIQSDKSAIVHLLLTDIYGRTVKKLNTSIQVGVNNFALSINNLPNGQYILKAEGMSLNTQKIIVSH